MTRYAAFLRGILPTNPNMRNEKLRGVFEGLGFSNVQTIISSGNVIFDSSSKNAKLLEDKIEKALATELGIKSPVFIRSEKELDQIVKRDPFKGADHSRTSYLIVTFTKKTPRELFNTLNIEKAGTPDFMRNIEKEFGKDLTTRTWKTVLRIVAKWK